jgi:hypothetical protein
MIEPHRAMGVEAAGDRLSTGHFQPMTNFHQADIRDRLSLDLALA